MRYRDEDRATAALGSLLSQSQPLSTLFLAFLFGKKPVPPLVGDRINIRTQHRGSNSKLDLLLSDGSTNIVIESKVNDRPNIHQLEKYHRYILNRTGRKPHIFWLLQRRSVGLGVNRYLTESHTWNELSEFLAGATQLSAKDQRSVQQFITDLRNNGVLLPEGEKHRVRVHRQKYSYRHAEEILEGIASRFDGVSYEVLPPENELPHRLIIGRSEWYKKFDDGWIKRIWLYYEPENTKYFFRPAILFYNRRFVPDASFAIRQFSAWAEICHAAGLSIWRNKPGKWRGKHNLKLEPPFKIERPVKFVFADEPERTKASQRFNTAKDAPGIEIGIEIIRRYLELADMF